MSSKLDCLFTLKQLLNDRFTKLAVSNVPAAQTFQTLVLTADNIDDGSWAIIQPTYEPLSPKFLICVSSLNDSIEANSPSALPLSFANYITVLTNALQT